MKLTRRQFTKLFSLAPFLLPALVPKPVPEVPTGQRIGIIADTQNSDNVPAVFSLIAEQASEIEFFVVGGDLADIVIPGNDDGQWQWTIQQYNRLGSPKPGHDRRWYAVPGNHDICRDPNAGEFGPAEATAIAKWQQYVGPLRFSVDSQYTRFVGFNWLDWSIENQSWLATQLDTTLRKVVIQHLPFAGEEDTDWYGPNHQAKLDFFLSRGVNLFIGGHHHNFIVSRLEGAISIVCPSIAPVAFFEVPHSIPNGSIPMPYAVRGWLELIDAPDSLYCEFFRAYDGVMTWRFRIDPYQAFFPMILGE